MTEQKRVAGNYSIQEKWGEALDAGFLVVPSTLLRYQHQLGISDSELVVLLNLLMSWRKVDEFPFPRSSTMARRMGVSQRTVQRHLDALEEKGLIRRFRRKESTADDHAKTHYDLSGVVARLKKMGGEATPSRGGVRSTNATSTGAPH